MAQRTYQDIQREADRLFGKGASDQKFEWRRAQQAAAGLELEQKTRGGVAGAYDRNKGLVQAALPTLAGILVPGAGALAGGLVGGLAKGLDRPGEGGIGLDVGQAARGAMAGAGLGAAGAAARTGLQNLMTPNAPAAAPAPAPAGPTTAVTRTSADARGMLAGAGDQGDLVSQAMQGGRAMTPTPTVPTFSPSATSQRIAQMGATPTAVTPQVGSAMTAARPSMSSILGGMPMSDVANANVVFQPRNVFSRIGGAMLNRPEIPMAIGQTILGYQQGKQQQDQAEREFKASEEERKRRQQAQEALAQLLMPLFQQQVQQMGQGRQPQRG